MANRSKVLEINSKLEEEATQTDEIDEKRYSSRRSFAGTSDSDSDLGSASSSVTESDLSEDDSDNLIQYFSKTVHGIFSHENLSKSTQTFVNPTVVKGERLARDVVFYLLEENLHLIGHDYVSKRLRQLVMEMLFKYELTFTRMANFLQITPENGYEAFTGVADQLFLYDGVSWDRIIALYAFAGRLAVYCKQKKIYRFSRSIPQYMAKYIADFVAPFVHDHGGWEQLCIEFPPQDDTNNKVWRCLLLTGASLGLMATLLAIR